MKTMNHLLIIIFFIFLSFSSLCYGVEIEIQGEGRVEITEDLNSVQSKAKKAAVKNAVSMAIVKVLGNEALNDQRVASKLDEMVSQFSTYKIKQTDSASKEETQYVVVSKIVIDDTKFRSLISDLGIAINTNLTRSSKIMVIMDEFFTQPSDLQKQEPLREVTIYKYDRDASSKEGDSYSEKHQDSKSSSKKNSDIGSLSTKSSSIGSLSAKNEEKGSLSAKNEEKSSLSGKNKESGSYSGNANAGASGGGGSANASASQKAKYSQQGSLDAKYSQKGSVDAKYSQKGSLDVKHDDRASLDKTHDKRSAANSAASSKSSLEYGSFADASESEHEFFTNIKEYQPKNGVPDGQNLTIKSIQSAFQTYDIRIVDSDRFKSKFFKDKPVTIDKMEKSEDLDRFVKFSKDENDTDFFSIGTSVIIDRKIDPNTGKNVCDGIVSIKVYSTSDSESIASGSLTDQGSGNTPDSCRSDVASKMGEGLGNIVSNKIQEYWKKRQMYGVEYSVVLTGDLPRAVKSQFVAALKKVEGMTSVKERKSESGSVAYNVSYNGKEILKEMIFAQIDASSVADSFKNYEASVDGNQIKFYPLKK